MTKARRRAFRRTSAVTGQVTLSPTPSTGPSPFGRPPPPLFRTEWRAQLAQPFDPYLEDARELIRTVEARALYAPQEREALAQHLEQVAVSIRPRSPRAAIELLTAAARIRALPPSASTGQVRMGLPQGVDITAPAVDVRMEPSRILSRAACSSPTGSCPVWYDLGTHSRSGGRLPNGTFVSVVRVLHSNIAEVIVPAPWRWPWRVPTFMTASDLGLSSPEAATGQVRMGLPQGVDIVAPAVDVRAAPRFNPVRPRPDFIRAWTRAPSSVKSGPNSRYPTVLELPLHAEVDVEYADYVGPDRQRWAYVSADVPGGRVQGYLEVARITYRSPNTTPFVYETACASEGGCWLKAFPGGGVVIPTGQIPIPPGFPLVLLRGVRRAPGDTTPGSGRAEPWFLVHAPTLLGIDNEGWLPARELTRFPR